MPLTFPRRTLLVAGLLLAGCARRPQPPAPGAPEPVVVAPVPPARSDTAPRAPARPAQPPRLLHALVPMPASIVVDTMDAFVADSLTTTVTIDSTRSRETSRELTRLARLVGRMIGRDTAPAYRRLAPGAAPDTNTIQLRLDSAAVRHDEGYVLAATHARVTITARTTEGLFRGIQTFRQLMPVVIEHRSVLGRRLRMPAVRIEDAPRFAWRASMLDVARHFLPVEGVKRHIDAMALYKLNVLHLHLSDDQGWRIEIRKHPRLTRVGGSTQVGGGPAPEGGYYTQAQFRELVRYARERYIEIVPEIDMPGHTNAALASIRTLNCDRKAPPLYTGIKVGFSALCVEREATYRWIDDVVREIAAISPSPYFHIGGDEVEKIAHPDYLRFIERAQRIVHKHGKRMIGWGEVAPARLDTTTVVQHWRGVGKDSVFLHAERGGRVILSPGPKAYIDMKYDSSTVLGLRWAGMIEVRDTYDWDPATYLPAVTERSVLGVEAPLWSETLEKLEDFQFLAFPRLVALAEVGWSPQASRGWDEFRRRLAQHGPRLQALGINFYRSAQVEWAR